MRMLGHEFFVLAMISGVLRKSIGPYSFVNSLGLRPCEFLNRPS